MLDHYWPLDVWFSLNSHLNRHCEAWTRVLSNEKWNKWKKFCTSLSLHTLTQLLHHYSEIEIVLDTLGFLNHILKVTSQHMCLDQMQIIDQTSLPRSHVFSMYTYMCKTIPKAVRLYLSVSVSLHYEMNSVRTHWFCDLLSFLLFCLACLGTDLSNHMSSDLNYLTWNQ